MIPAHVEPRRDLDAKPATLRRPKEPYQRGVEAAESNAETIGIGAASMAVGHPSLAALAGRLSMRVRRETDQE